MLVLRHWPEFLIDRAVFSKCRKFLNILTREPSPVSSAAVRRYTRDFTSRCDLSRYALTAQATLSFSTYWTLGESCIELCESSLCSTSPCPTSALSSEPYYPAVDLTLTGSASGHQTSLESQSPILKPCSALLDICGSINIYLIC
jgi:hypothetical protein